MKIGLLAGAVGLAVALPAFANPRAELREVEGDGRFAVPQYPFTERQGRPGSAPVVDLGNAFGVVGRGDNGADGALATMFDDFESTRGWQVLPAALLNQLGLPDWGGAAAGVTGRSHISFAQPAPTAGIADEAIGGNATNKMRVFVSAAQPPDLFFTVWSYNFSRTNTSPNPGTDTRFVFRPDVGQNARMKHDAYVTAITTLFTSEPIYVSSGFIVSRLLWGGTNTTPDIGLPIGPIPDFFTLGPNPASFTTGLFVPCRDPWPAGANVAVPTNAWFDIIHETRVDGNIYHIINRRDGNGERTIYIGTAIITPRFDRWSVRSSLEGANDAFYTDNLSVEGVEFTLPIAPPLVCGPTGYNDNLEWLFFGGLTGQSTRWFDARSSDAVIAAATAPWPNTPANNRIGAQDNVFPDDRYRRENGSALPLTYATAGNPFRVCLEMRIPSPNSVVRGFTLVSLTDNTFVTRLFIGREDPNDPQNPFYVPRMYVQVNPDYDPIDPEGTSTPFDNVPVIGTDVVDTGVNWIFNTIQNLCAEVTVSGGLTFSRNNTNFYTGSTLGNVNSVDRLDLESENNSLGAGGLFQWDNLSLSCQTLPNVTFPPLTLPYLDNLEWANPEGVTIGVYDDDGNTGTPARWASAPNMPVITLAGKTKVLRQTNLFQDTPPVVPSDTNFALFTQASSEVPAVDWALNTRGYVTQSRNKLTDSLTTRTWFPAERNQFGTFLVNTRIVYSSVTDTFWIQRPLATLPVCPSTDPRSEFVDTGAGLASQTPPINFNTWFQLSIHKNVNGEFTYRINGRLLRWATGPSAGQPVKAASLTSCDGSTAVTHNNLDRYFLQGGDDEMAPNSILYTDDVRVWGLPCLGDTDNNGVINFTDLNNVLAFFGQSAPNGEITGNIAPDANGDGVPDDNSVTFTDLNAVLSGFGRNCN